MRFSWLYHHLDYLRSIRLDAATLPRPLICNSCAEQITQAQEEGIKCRGRWVRRASGNNGQCWSSLSWLLQWIAFWAALVAATSSHSPFLTLLPSPFSLLSILNSSLHKPLGSHCFEGKTTQKNERWTLSASTKAKGFTASQSEREVRGHRRCPFARNIIRLIWSSLKLWSISRFTAPKCRKFAHSFGSLVGNLSKSIIHIHIYIVLYTLLYTYSNVFRPCHAHFSRSSSQAKRLQIGNAKFSVSFLRLPS